MSSMTATRLEENDISALEEACVDPQGRIRVMPYSFYQRFSKNDIGLFCVKYGVYVLPTEELISFLKEEMGFLRTIEIGAGNGSVGRALGIRMFDSFIQRDDPGARAYVRLIRQEPVIYGADVNKVEAVDAVRKYKPECVLGCFVTHKNWDVKAMGDIKGMLVAEEKILKAKSVKKYIVCGNLKVHANKPLLDLPHRTVELEGYVTRSQSPELNRIFIWEK